MLHCRNKKSPPPPPPFLAKTLNEGGVFSRARDYLRVLRVSLDGLRKKRDCSYSDVASHAGVFRGALFVGREEIRAPLKTPACEANSDAEQRRSAGELISPNFVPRGFSVKNQMERTVCC